MARGPGTGSKPNNIPKFQTYASFTKAKHYLRHIKGEAGSPFTSRGRLLTVSDCSEFLGISVPLLEEYIEQGLSCLPTAKGTMVNTGLVLKFIHERTLGQFAKEVEETINPAIDLNTRAAQADMRKKIAQAEREELNLAKEQEQVANIEDMFVNFEFAISNVRPALMSLIGKLPGECAHRGEEDIREIMEREIRNILEELCNYEHLYKES